MSMRASTSKLFGSKTSAVPSQLLPVSTTSRSTSGVAASGGTAAGGVAMGRGAWVQAASSGSSNRAGRSMKDSGGRIRP